MKSGSERSERKQVASVLCSSFRYATTEEGYLDSPNYLVQIQLQPKLSLDLHTEIGEDEEPSVGVVDVLELEERRDRLTRRVSSFSVLEEMERLLRLSSRCESRIPV